MTWLFSLFQWFDAALRQGAAAAVGASLVWGILSILLSPCHLSSIPLVVGFIGGRGPEERAGRALALSSLFGLGILVTLGVLGAVTALLGRMWGDIGGWGIVAVAVLLMAVGAWMADLLPLPGGFSLPALKRGGGGAAALLLGLLFGAALGPCSFGFMMPLLLVVFGTANRAPDAGFLLLLAYALGHTGTIVAAGTFTRAVQRYLRWTERSRGPVVVRRVCGALVGAAGVFLLVWEAAGGQLLY